MKVTRSSDGVNVAARHTPHLDANPVPPSVDCEHLYSPLPPEDVVESGASRVEPDRLRAAFMGEVLDLPDPGLVTTPLLVLGSEHDGMKTHRHGLGRCQVLGTATGLPYSARAFTNERFLNPAWFGGLAGVPYREAV
jgi:hypothetical protein